MEILFWRHQSPAQKKLGKCTINCRITIDGKRADIGSTNIEVIFEHFDTKRQEVTNDDPNFVFHNLRLQTEFKTPILAYYTEFMLAKQPITADAIKRRFQKITSNNIGILLAYDTFLKDFEEKTKPKKKKNGQVAKPRRSSSTLRPLKVCKNKLSEYLSVKKELLITINELSESWFSCYRDWLEEYPHEQSTVIKHLRTLKQLTKFSKKKKLCTIDPFEYCEVEKEEEKEPKFLKIEQLVEWSKFKFMSKMAQEVADVFTLFCWTGFHYTDLKQIIDNPEKYIRKGVDKKEWIFKEREKTEVVAKVPIYAFPEINSIVEKYDGWHNIPIKQNHIMNQWLKICVAEINIHLTNIGIEKIYEELSVKHGRCTLSDYWLNELNNKTDDLLPILGRKSADGLGRYARRDERSVSHALKKR